MYTVDYFIKKFEAIPENLWCVMSRAKDNQRCALGWCYPTSEEAKASQLWNYSQTSQEEKELNAFIRLINPSWAAGGVNNGIYPQYSQPTPKQRILAALNDIKAMQEKEQKPERIKTVYVSVPETVKEQVLELIQN